MKQLFGRPVIETSDLPPLPSGAISFGDWRIWLPLIDRTLDTLARAKREHYSDGEGLDSCGYSIAGFCDCGAKAINDEIDARLAEWRALADACFPPWGGGSKLPEGIERTR